MRASGQATVPGRLNGPGPAAAEGILTRSSPYSVAETLTRLEAAITERGLTVFARFDHAAAARSAGLQMPETTVLVFGNPRAGTPVMLAAPLIALELPLRVLVWSAAGDVVDTAGPGVAAGRPAPAPAGSPVSAASGRPSSTTVSLAPAAHAAHAAHAPGGVFVSYTAPAYLASRFGVPAELGSNIGAVGSIVEAALR